MHKTTGQNVSALAMVLALSLLQGSLLHAQDVMNVISTGVGIGTDAPQAELEIKDLNADNIVGLALTNSAPEPQTWGLGATAAGVLAITRLDTAGIEMLLRERNDATGTTLTVGGSVAGTQFINTSARHLKTAFERVDPARILAGVIELPVSSWQYKSDPRSTRHVGPVAEDFQHRFGLGDGKTISTVDAQGISLAAIQGLHKLLLEQAAQLELLREANQRLEERIAALESKP